MSVDSIGRSGFFPQENSMPKAAEAGLGSVVYKESINLEKLQAKANDETNLREYSKEDIKSAIRKAEQMAMIFDRSLKFKYVEEADIYQVHVIDHAHDDKVIRKIPPDELVHFIAAVNQMLGALFDTEI
ncbi:flagellar protein FlaG [Acetomicrobium hydrogeniformans]|jgi:flagellar protein FlaG|uniref:FlaG protein n=1 Tax=Acetomicrobium hydrogeniformans ATCC BAA-1850 TaxID=592015 RepID=A0A0T5XBX9_9BACT|nr:flagellar protein FlaG [Acetomicrobium hydrogeniformans]KRT35867.1 FlaG protein [Acetomicrobium hydrogeniformans ATCC BAA-1850]